MENEHIVATTHRAMKHIFTSIFQSISLIFLPFSPLFSTLNVQFQVLRRIKNVYDSLIEGKRNREEEKTELKLNHIRWSNQFMAKYTHLEFWTCTKFVRPHSKLDIIATCSTGFINNGTIPWIWRIESANITNEHKKIALVLVRYLPYLCVGNVRAWKWELGELPIIQCILWLRIDTVAHNRWILNGQIKHTLFIWFVL